MFSVADLIHVYMTFFGFFLTNQLFLATYLELIGTKLIQEGHDVWTCFLF